MKYLLHCIVEQDQAESGGDAPAQGISVIAGYGLAAVVSREEPDEPPSVARLLVYERVVESIHAVQTALPLRYGCWMESKEEIRRLLEEHREEYQALLKRLDGMTEMGIRLLIPACAPAPPAPTPAPGAAYLTFLRQRYDREGALTADEDAQAGRIADRLAGRFIEERREISSSRQGRMLSLAYLIAKDQAGEFCRQAREITPPGGAKLLMSGPWPPYSFVSSVR
jgi:hypothetical protein